jgi:hypothetical protein
MQTLSGSTTVNVAAHTVLRSQPMHCDLFGPLKTSESSKNFILCMTDAFTKYVELVALPYKEALTVTSAIFNRWICRF